MSYNMHSVIMLRVFMTRCHRSHHGRLDSITVDTEITIDTEFTVDIIEITVDTEIMMIQRL